MRSWIQTWTEKCQVMYTNVPTSIQSCIQKCQVAYKNVRLHTKRSGRIQSCIQKRQVIYKNVRLYTKLYTKVSSCIQICIQNAKLHTKLHTKVRSWIHSCIQKSQVLYTAAYKSAKLYTKLPSFIQHCQVLFDRWGVNEGKHTKSEGCLTNMKPPVGHRGPKVGSLNEKRKNRPKRDIVDTLFHAFCAFGHIWPRASSFPYIRGVGASDGWNTATKGWLWVI